MEETSVLPSVLHNFVIFKNGRKKRLKLHSVFKFSSTAGGVRTTTCNTRA